MGIPVTDAGMPTMFSPTSLNAKTTLPTWVLSPLGAFLALPTVDNGDLQAFLAA